jgi:hypothetical protein
MHEARKRGVLFDLGHGAASFLWPVADRALRLGFPPDTISTDIHAGSILATQSDMSNYGQNAHARHGAEGDRLSLYRHTGPGRQPFS